MEVGDGQEAARKRGSDVHDEIYFDKDRGFFRTTNRAGGIEGGMTNGETVMLRGAMKPISTIAKPLKTVDVTTKRPVKAFKERADVCAVPSAAVIAEAAVAFALAKVLLEKFGGDCLADIEQAVEDYKVRIRQI